MSTPSWLPEGALRPGDPLLRPLARLFAAVCPAPTTPWAFAPVPVVVERAAVAPDGSRTWEGTAALWDSDRARFGISATASDVPTGAWVAKPMSLASGISLSGLSTDVFWMILSGQVAAQPWELVTGEPPVLAMARHLVGPVVIAGKRILVRLDVLGEALTASVDFTAELTPVERAAIGADPGPFHTGEHGLRFTDLAHLLGTDHDPHADLAWLPEPLRDHTLFSLVEVHLQIDPADDRKLVGVGVAVEFGGGTRWPLVPGFDALTVSNIVARFDVDHPLDAAARFPRVSVSGDIGIGSATVSLRVRWPDLAIEGALGERPIVLSELLAAAHLPALGEHGVEISELGFRARPTGKQASFTLHARARNVVSIPISAGRNLDLRDLEIDLALARGDDRSVTVDVRGELMIGTTGLMLDVASDHGGDGWTLSARLVGDPVGDPVVLDVMAWIGERFGDHPLPATLPPDETISALAVEYHTGSRDASFAITTGLTLGTATGVLALDLALAHHGDGGYAATIGGQLTLGAHTFDVLFARDGVDVLVAAYQLDAGTTVGALLAAVGLDLDIPVVVSDALLARAGDETLALVDMGATWDLTGLPLVGPALAGQHLALDLRLVAASEHWTGPLLGALNAHLPAGYRALAVPDGAQTLPRADLVVALTLGGETVHLDLGVALDPAKVPPPSTPPTAAVPVAAPPVVRTPGRGDDVTWYPLQRAFGPVHVRRVGARYDSAAKAIELLLDGDLSLGGLTLSLDGLSVSTDLTTFTPTFGLRGLGLDLRQGSVELGGMFLQLGENEYAGAALLRTETLSLSAIGAYGVIDGHPSLFVYAVLDYPLGGPSFFFVTGLAAGFGYNRRLLMPAIDRIAEFPLVAQAGAGGALPAASDLMATLESFEQYLPPAVGEMFAAVGIKFTSFTLIDSFALLSVAWGARLRIDLLGSSTLVAPAPVDGVAVTPVVEIHLGVHAQFVPDEGFLGVDARLTPTSYLLSRACHLTGGAAFHSWFSGPHAGDFVVTMGGYHPAFVAPPHYPTVPRLAFQWQVTDEVALKGDLYFALTGHAIMAGGHLDAAYHSGSTEAWFRTGADFMIAWQPFAYDAEMYVNVGGRWNALRFEVGADVHVWGPEFAGYAEVDLGITSFTVHFGDTAAPAVDPVDWDTFRAASLPALDAVATISCVRGLVATLDPEPGFVAEWVVSAHDLVVSAGSQIPADRWTVNGATPDGVVGPLPALGVAPMGVAVGDLTSVLEVTVARAGTPEDMRPTPVLKTVPTALWGAPVPAGQRPGPNAESHVRGTLAGFELRPRPHHAPDATTPVPRDQLAYDDIPATVPDPGWLPSPVRADDLVPVEETARARAALLRGLGVEPGEVRFGPAYDDLFLAPPTAVALTVAPESS